MVTPGLSKRTCAFARPQFQKTISECFMRKRSWIPTESLTLAIQMSRERLILRSLGHGLIIESCPQSIQSDKLSPSCKHNLGNTCSATPAVLKSHWPRTAKSELFGIQKVHNLHCGSASSIPNPSPHAHAVSIVGQIWCFLSEQIFGPSRRSMLGSSSDWILLS